MTALQTVLFISNHGDVRGGGEISLLGLLDGLRRSSSWRPLLVVPEEGTVAVKSRAMDIPTYVIPMPTLRKDNAGWWTAHILQLARLIQDDRRPARSCQWNQGHDVWRGRRQIGTLPGGLACPRDEFRWASRSRPPLDGHQSDRQFTGRSTQV